MKMIGNFSKVQKLLRESKEYCKQGKFLEAKLIYNNLLKFIPSHPEVLGNLGTIEIQNGNTELGITYLKKSLSIDPRNFNFLNNLGNALLENNNPLEAVQYFVSAIKLSPRSYEILYNKARALKSLQRYKEAIECYKSSIQLNPNNHYAFMNLGFIYNQQGKYLEALENYNQGLAIAPNNFLLFYNRGIVYENLKKFDAALDDYSQSIQLNNSFENAFLNKSGILIKLNQCNKALETVNFGININPNNLEFLFKKALIYEELKDFDSALKSYDSILKKNPNNSKAKLKKSYLCLSLNNFEIGWDLYENRWWDKNFIQSSKPELLDFNVSEKIIFIWGEQGPGDQIIYSSLLLEAFNTKNKFYVALDSRLIPIFKRSFSNLDHVTFISLNDSFTDDNYDYHLPLGSLGKFFRKSLEDFNSQPIGYLKENKIQSTSLKKKIMKPHHKICGISWFSKNNEIGEEKSLLLNKLLPILSLPNITFVNLQYGDVQEEISDLLVSYRIKIQLLNEIDNFSNLDGLASLISACDYIVTTSNVTAHIAGALNRETYLLIPYNIGKIWYWGESIKNSLWYPSVHIFRCDASGSWDQPIKNLANKLKDMSDD